MIRVGIDIGSANARIGVVNDYGIPALLPDLRDLNQFDTPCCVSWGPHGALVGQIESQAGQDPDASSPIRLLTSQIASEQSLFVDRRGQSWTQKMVMALILRKLKRDAEAYAADKIGSALLTVPAHFDEQQRIAFREAAELASLETVNLVDEPIAIAYHYGFGSIKQGQMLLVYHVGSSGCSVSLLQAGESGTTIRATASSDRCGGDFIDAELTEIIIGSMSRSLRDEIRADSLSMVQLRSVAQTIKLKFSDNPAVSVRQSMLIGGSSVILNINSTQFTELAERSVNQSIDVCVECLSRASVGWKDVDRVLISGASSQNPIIKRSLISASTLSPDRFLVRTPQYAGVFGAIILAKRKTAESSLSAGRKRAALGMRVMNGVTAKPEIKILIPTDSPIPTEVKSTFYTTRADQTRLVLDLVQVESEGSVVSLGHVAFGPISNPRKNRPVEVLIGYDDRGMIKLKAKDPESGKEIANTLAGTTENRRSMELCRRIIKATNLLE